MSGTATDLFLILSLGLHYIVSPQPMDSITFESAQELWERVSAVQLPKGPMSVSAP